MVGTVDIIDANAALRLDAGEDNTDYQDFLADEVVQKAAGARFSDPGQLVQVAEQATSAPDHPGMDSST